MNWAWRITLLLSSFMLFMSYLVYRTFNTKVDLVSEDYYEEELQYQRHIDEARAASLLDHPMRVTRENDALIFSFPSGKPQSGSIKFFKPSDAALDFVVDIMTDDEGNQKFPIPANLYGFYRVQVSWKWNDRNYYKEDIVQL